MTSSSLYKVQPLALTASVMGVFAHVSSLSMMPSLSVSFGGATTALIFVTSAGIGAGSTFFAEGLAPKA